MTAAVLSGILVGAVLAAVRIRPDHRLRRCASPPPSSPAPAPAPRLAARRLVGRRRSARIDAVSLAGWCDALARDIRAGASLVGALRSTEPPAGSRLVELRGLLDRGVPLQEAVRIPMTTSDEQAVLTVLAACAHHGGPAAQPLDRVASMLRRRAADAAERAVHSAQARLSALVMTVLPGAVLALLIVTSSPVRASVRTPLGSLTVAVGLGLNALGWWWMRRIIAGGVR